MAKPFPARSHGITQYLVATAFAIANVSLANPGGLELVHCISMSGVIAAFMLCAALTTSLPHHRPGSCPKPHEDCVRNHFTQARGSAVDLEACKIRKNPGS
jgi:hypothetical protein